MQGIYRVAAQLAASRVVLSSTELVSCMFVPHRRHTFGPLRPVTGIALFFYVDVRTSQETHIRANAACYGDSFNLPPQLNCHQFD
jgi:hypothetical protein